MSMAIGLHTLSAVLWLGGMFFAHQVLRPVVVDLLDPPIRLQLWLGVFRRFFRWVWLAVTVLLGSGLWIIEFNLGGIVGSPMHVHYMLGAGLIMMGIFAYVYIVPYRALSNAVAEKNWSAGGAAPANIRRLVGINTIIGILVVVIATAGKYYGMPALFSL